MNSLVHLKIIALLFRSLVILTAIVCSPLSPVAQAVVPPPDGGYPGGNTAEGQNALLSLTTGGFNTAVGFFSLQSDTTGQFNTGSALEPFFSIPPIAILRLVQEHFS